MKKWWNRNMQNYYEYNETCNLIQENASLRLNTSRNKPTRQNKFTTNPQGIIIQDSYNNPFFPIYPKPKIDTSKFDLADVYNEYREKYSQEKTIILPWHYCIEMVGDIYCIFNTRPLDMQFPITNEEAKNNWKFNWDEPTEMFFKENIFDISEAIHVCIIGNTDLDVYTTSTYSLIGNFCITPVVRKNKIPSALFQRIFGFNIGGRFKLNNITRFVKS
ncbi:MAG: hypothetical protein ACOC22_02230 [bacterium]